MLEIIKTNDGYMVQSTEGDYVCDANGNNLFDTYEEAEAVFYGTPVQTNWAKANEAFYKWERDYGEESDLSYDDLMIWVEGYLHA